MKGISRAFFNRFPRLKARLKDMRDVIAPRSSVSSHYVPLSGSEVEVESDRLRGAWQASGLPKRQRRLVNKQLASYRGGSPVDVFDVMVKALRKVIPVDESSSVLEIGCSSGFYSEVFQIAKLPINYAGCDYSEAFIALARGTYPNMRFDVEDATTLSYPDEAFDVVISGCCLLHIPEYAIAVAETSRVAKHHAIFHRTPVVFGSPNEYFRKQAYGVETVEIHFSEPEFLRLLHEHRLELIETYTLNEEHDAVDSQKGSALRTYVCRKATR